MNYCKWLILRLRIIKHFETLKDYLSEHVDDSILTSYTYLCDVIEELKSDSSNKEDVVLQAYKSLYPPKGGLSDFYIWDDDYQKRCGLNEPLERIHKNLWNLLKHYL